jgi:hypothetical protein
VRQLEARDYFVIVTGRPRPPDLECVAMPIDPSPPTFIAGRLCWDIHTDGPETKFWVAATSFKYAVGLRPRARADDAKAKALAVRNWAVLELIARESLSSGRIAKTDASKGWLVHHTIDDAAFSELFVKYRAQVIP